ncbi:cation-transporting P-type ATPase [Streptomyces sp. NA02536]|uniref:P-type ATPase n=1 Tax=Streptomyces sp. NA02536 TaxID=2742133 RepID=UPI0020CAE5AA|nr:cation-transporting P-type ATPase [Streptomyces sp. NA02536]
MTKPATTAGARPEEGAQPPPMGAEACGLPAEDVVRLLRVDPGNGLTAGEAAARAAVHGPNRMAEAARRPEWLRFLDQFRNWLIGVLLLAAVVAAAVGEVEDALVITVVLQINAVLGYLQERRAERSLEALRRMLVPTARVRRDGVEHVVGADLLVPGDVVLLEAGDRVPADGRLMVAESVEAAEAALTGESQPVAMLLAELFWRAAVGGRTGGRRAGRGRLPRVRLASKLTGSTRLRRIT